MTQHDVRELIPMPTPIEVKAESVWSDPIPLASTLRPVAKFDLAMLPAALRGRVLDIAERMNVPMDFVAVPMMIALAALIGRRVGIRPERHSDWTEAANLWGAIIGPPGTLKSPAVREAFAPILALEKEAARKHELALAELKPKLMLHEIEEAQAKQTAKTLLKKGGGDPFARNDALEALIGVGEPEMPIAKRYVTNDATPEKLGELCKGNPDGLLIHRDEFLTLFTELDQEEKAAGRGFVMGGWTGLDGYTVDRIGRGTVRIEAVNLSLFGTAQPNRLKDYMRRSFLKHDDGLVQRIQLLVWPDMPGKYVSRDRPINTGAKEEASACFDNVIKMDPEKIGAQMSLTAEAARIPFLRFSSDAQDAFDTWRVELEDKVAALEPGDPWRGHMSKYRGLAPRLALVAHIAGQGSGPVSAPSWAIAERWIKYLETHALRAYDAMRTDNTDIAQRVAAKIKDGSLEDRFTARDVYRRQWSGLKQVGKAKEALKVLEEYDWISSEMVVTGSKSKTHFMINPKLKLPQPTSTLH